MVQVPASTGLTQEQVNEQIAAAQVKWEEDRNKQGGVTQVAGSRRTFAPRDSGSASPKRNVPANPRRDQQDVAFNQPGGEDFFNPNEERVPRLTDLLGAVKAPNKEDER